MKVLLITPPFTQLNTPYPATAYLKPVLEMAGHEVRQIDLGNKTILKVFSSEGLKKIYKDLENHDHHREYTALNRFVVLKNSYMETIDPVVSFLQGENNSAAYKINSGKWLPQGDRQEYASENNLFFSDGSQMDRARHTATLYLEEIGDIISSFCDESFGFSRYGERIALSPPEFDELKRKIDAGPSFISRIFTQILTEEIESFHPELCGFTVPFPGNLFSTLICSRMIKDRFPPIKTLMGGGYINTELRNLKDRRIFEYIDFITLDDGEQPLLSLCEFLAKTKKKTDLKRTFIAGEKGNVEYMNCKDTEDISHRDLPAPDYSTLMDQPYLSLLPVTNKMHRLWSEGKWNKMTLAHGCYWHRCAFCDTSLDYIKRYEPSDACTIVDKIEKLIEETGNRAFHFVDEAAPPALLKKMAIELIVRNISISWWTNIRFEKSFTPDLCRLLAKSGCIAISGGLEVASDRLLSRIDKGVSVKQVSSVAAAFSSSGIMVHTYLMYGFPGQSEQEIIDALENVRQMFDARLIDSAFWHQFALTAHSPAGLNPDSYGIKRTGPAEGSFARNDLYFKDSVQYDPSDYSQGLGSALSAFMSGRELKLSVNRWFAFKTPRPTVKRNFIKTIIKEMRKSLHIHNYSRFIWTGAELRYKKGFIELQDTDGAQLIKADKNMWNFLSELLKICNIKDHRIITTVQVELLCGKYSIDLDALLSSELFSVISAYGLLII